ncbi:MAG: patatin-like phospholipase family protein, partial [Planctomycetota bacterium]|nr:patatin-like phospholipase family protein [Planctomycetota bacterium]
MFHGKPRPRRAAFLTITLSTVVALIVPAGCLQPIPGPVTPSTPEVLHARLWVSQGKVYTFPEQVPPHETKPTTGVCLSGGGTRALSAGMGQLRALNQLGLLKHVQYLSCVSGGAWLGTAFTYYERGARDDAEFLGPVTLPEAITWPGLQHLPMSCVGHTATKNFAEAIWELLEGGHTPKDLIWIQAVGETFLEPFGLYDETDPDSEYFSLDADTVREIKDRNPTLHHKRIRFHTVRSNDTDVKRPYLIVNSSLIWPVGRGPAEQLVGFEYTPLYAGNPFRLELTYKPFLKPAIRRTVGGGFIEPFAYGCYAPSGPVKDGLVRVTQPPAFSLADAAGTSSSAYARILGEVNHS